ncbi:MAG TPA: methyltransferase domain-containing protein [Bacillales bacterium]|nr:methyltransferase domain-containing protein [Bacillales bacterium]
MNYTYQDCLALFGVGGAHPGSLPLTKYILSKEKMDETKLILDVGCGTGQTSAYISKQFKSKVTSLDYNKMMVEKARQRFSSLKIPIEIRHGNAETLPFAENSFDFILSESVTAFTDLSLTIPEYKRVLKSGGVLLAIEMVLEKPLSDQEQNSIRDFYGVTELLSEPEWYDHFQKAGFKNITVDSIDQQLDEEEIQLAVDFSLSENIDETCYEILDQHEYFMLVYKDMLGFRVFRCCT